MDILMLAQEGDVFERLVEKEGLALVIPMLGIACGTLIALASIVIAGVRSIAVGRSREQTKRELAAYVAEGTLDADKAVAMLSSGSKPDEPGGCGA